MFGGSEVISFLLLVSFSACHQLVGDVWERSVVYEYGVTMELFIWMGVLSVLLFHALLDDDLHIVCYLFFFTSPPPAQDPLVFI